jgi:hypothetical protein
MPTVPPTDTARRGHPMSPVDHEYAALRHTITLRGTVRMTLAPAVVLGWAGLAGWLWVAGAPPLTPLLPLLVLATGFEAVHALHAGAERIGRYLQVRFETGSQAPAWETTAMTLGPALPGGGIDPLFTHLFVGATLVNLLPSLAVNTSPALVVVLAGHALVLGRVVRTRRAAARQRAADLADITSALQASGRVPIDQPPPASTAR